MSDSTPLNPCPTTVALGYSFDLPSADLTLRSADDVHFHVHGAVLSIASPFFRDMLSLPPPRDDESTCDRSRPVVPVPEDSKTLKTLLQLCYPINKQSLVQPEEIAPVLQAALKYEMDWPVSLLRRDLVSLMPRRPLKTWAIACQTGLGDVACQAALEMLRSYRPGDHVHGAVSVLQEMVEKEGVGVLDGISAKDYFLLREFLLANNPKKVLTDFSPKPDVDASGPSVSERRVTTFLPRFELPDLVLRCPSGTSHLAHQLILSFHSPVIEALISSAKSARPMDASADADTQPPLEVDIDLDSDIVVTLLRMCYDNVPCAPSTLSDLGPVILAADKYQMPLIQRAAKERWDELARSGPLDAYLVATQYGLAPHLKVAARAVLEQPIRGAYVHSMEWASALSYHRLVEYHGLCADAVRDAVARVTAQREDDYDSDERMNFKGGKKSTLHKFPLGGTMKRYIRDAIKGQRGESPGREFKEFTLAALLEQSQYSKRGSLWPQSAAEACHALLARLSELSRELPQVITDAISQVELKVD